MGEKSYILRLKSAILRYNETPKEASHTFSYAAKSAVKMAELVEDGKEKVKWYRRAYNARKHAIILNDGFDKEYLGYLHGFAGDDLTHISELTHYVKAKVDHLIKAYVHRRESERITSRFDLRRARTSLWQANEIARIISEIHPDIKESARWFIFFELGSQYYKETYGRGS